MKVLIIIACLAISSCATYKITSKDDFQFLSEINKEPEIVKVNKYPSGFQCFEPLLFVLTLGIIPTHCVDTYDVLSDDKIVGQVSITSIGGWVALAIVLFPNWNYGFADNIKADVVDMIEERN